MRAEIDVVAIDSLHKGLGILSEGGGIGFRC